MEEANQIGKSRPIHCMPLKTIWVHEQGNTLFQTF